MIQLTPGMDPRWESISQNVDSLLKAWAKQIEEASKEFEVFLKKSYFEQTEKRAEEQRAYERGLDEIAQAQSAALALDGLLGLSRSNDGVTVSIPSGFRAATSAPIPGADAIVAAINSILQEGAQDDPNVPDLTGQASARWALGAGLLPHPADLSQVMQGLKLDPLFADQLGQLGDKLTAIDGKRDKFHQLQASNGLERLDVLSTYSALLGAYGADRLVGLVTQPQVLVGTGSPALPVIGAQQQGSMSPRDYNAMLDAFQRR
jgi:hypothetical protein